MDPTTLIADKRIARMAAARAAKKKARGLRPMAPCNVVTKKMEAFCQRWTGTQAGTLRACLADGISITDVTAATYVRDPRFIAILRRIQSAAPGDGIWSVDELKRFLTRVAAGIEPDGFTIISVRELISPCDDDYDQSLGGQQWRMTDREVPNYPDMGDRMRAADLLGKALGAYLDKIELNGDLKVSITDLLDDDLKHAKPIVDIGGAKAIESTQSFRTIGISLNRDTEVNEPFVPDIRESTPVQSTCA